MFYHIDRFLCALFCKSYLRMKVYGGNNVPRKGGCIVASNHVSYLDPIVLGVACPRKLNFMARHDLFKNLFFRCLLYSISVFPVKRDSADLSALKEAMRRVRSGQALALFPEGGRAEDGLPREPQAGIGFLAAKLNVPVIPAFIKGTYDALPKGAKSIRPAKVSVYFGPQISVEGGLPYQDIASCIMDNIRRLAC